MRAYRTLLAAAALAVAGSTASLMPAEAATFRAAPAAALEAGKPGFELVHKRRYRQDGYYRRHVRRPYYHHYGYRPYYYPYAYYDYPRYYRRPGISFHFGFGGPGYYYDW